MVTTAEHDMAKRNDVPVKMDAEVVTMAKMAAAGKGISLAEYLSESMRPIARRDMDQEHAKLTAGEKAPKKKGGPKV